jgi:hypothetical protein
MDSMSLIIANCMLILKNRVVMALIQTNAEREQEETALTDAEVETDEMFQNAGEKRRMAWRSARPAAQPGQQTTGPGHL